MSVTAQHKDPLKPPKPNRTKLMMVPDDVLEKIMSFMSYDEVSRCRLVCRRFNFMSQRVLNRGFHKVEKYHAQCLKKVKAQLPRRESERRKHHLARHCDILTAVETRLSLLGMTFLKYIDLNYCCFIPGKVLDEIYRVLRYVTSETSPVRAHEVLQELRDLSSMAMEYFDDRIAPTFKKHKDPVPKVHASISFPTSVKSSSRSSSSSSSSQEAKFQKMSHYVRQLLSKQNQAQKEITSLQNKNNELTKKCEELEKLLIEQQRIVALHDQKNKEHEKQILALSKHLKLNKQPELSDVEHEDDDDIPSPPYEVPPFDDDIKPQLEDLKKETGVSTTNHNLTFKIKREPPASDSDNPDSEPSAKRKRVACADSKESHKPSGSSAGSRTAFDASTSSIIKIEKMVSDTKMEKAVSDINIEKTVSDMQLNCASTSTSNKNRRKCSPATVIKVKEEPVAHRPITRSCTSKKDHQVTKRKM